MTPHLSPTVLRDERGFTLIEVLVAMVLGLIVSFAAFTMLEFTTRDVSHITDRVHVDQTGRVALEQIMLQLHSACVAPNANSIEPKSTATKLRFVSETSPLNAYKEPTSELATVRLHEIIYTKEIGTTQGTFTENSWPSYGTAPGYKFHNETETPQKRLLLKGVKETGTTPVFQYFRYYKTGDPGAKLGQLYPTSVPPENNEIEAEKIAKVTISFTLAPEGKEGIGFAHDRPIALEDSAILRLATASEASGNENLACTVTT